MLGGIVAGFCLGLLMSPDKGSNNRKKVMDAAGDWGQRLKHVFSNDGQAHRKTASGNGTHKTPAANRRTQSKRRS